MHAHQELTLEDVLNEIVQNDDEPSYANLERAIADYPQYRADITAFFAAWAIQADDESLETSAEAAGASNAVARGVSHALNLLHAKATGATGAVTAEGASEERLLKLIRAAGLDEARFAAECGLDEEFVIKLDRRRIQPAVDIPNECFEVMTLALVKHAQPSARLEYDVLAPHVIASVRGPALPMSAGAHLKSKTPPVIKTETFVEAILNSTLSEDDKESWLRRAKRSPP